MFVFTVKTNEYLMRLFNKIALISSVTTHSLHNAICTVNGTTYGIFISLQKGYAGGRFSATNCLTLKMFIRVHIL